MNRRSFFALLPALPFVPAALAKPATGGYVRPTVALSQLYSRECVLPRKIADDIRKLARGGTAVHIHGKPRFPLVGWIMPPDVGAAAYAEGMAYMAECAKSGGFDGRRI